MSDQLEQFLSTPAEGADTTGAEETAEAERLAAIAAAEETAAKEAEEAQRVAAAKEADKVPVAALMAERQKRQQAEQRAAELEAERQAEEKPFLGEEYEARFKETEQRFQNQLVTQKLDLSESFAREKYPDFEDKLAIFGDLCKENPNLYGQMIQQVNPAEFAYKAASNQLKMKEMANPDEYEKNLRAKIEAEVKERYDKEATKRDELPGSLAAARGTAGTQAATYAGPAPLKDVLGN